MGHLAIVATCSLNQWSLDFTGNLRRIKQSIIQAKQKGAKLRIGPELEITGYGCQDHFLESDTYLHAWESLYELLSDESLYDILIDVGMPVRHKNVNYNCRVFFYNSQILLIRPKQWLANDGNYREMRWFTPWLQPHFIEDHYLPRIIRELKGQETVPFGDGVISTLDTCIGVDMCEELFTPNSPHIHMGLDGIEIFTNGSGSHHELRKLHKRIELVKGATTKSGGAYLYANQKGCDGDRVYYDGCSMIALNGELLIQGSQFSLDDVEVLIATVDLEAIRTYRTSFKARSLQAANTKKYPRIKVNFALSINKPIPGLKPSKPQLPRYHTPAEEISLGPACWLWDYLRRSNQLGYFLPLSGGLDSCSTAVIVASMCDLVIKACKEKNEIVINDVKRITGCIPKTGKELANHIFHTGYIGTAHSGTATRQRAAKLAEEIGSYHLDFNMDNVISSILALFTLVTGNTPKFSVHGGSNAENLALQNIQARMRMVLSYLFAQLLPWCRGKVGGLLVLGSANVDESLRGYFTKYDCSSADLNPIGSISKLDLRMFLEYAHQALKLDSLPSFLQAQPSAELIPTIIKEGELSCGEQLDEAEMGMTYSELSIFGQLRKIDKLGPYSMFLKLISEWGDQSSLSEIAVKVKRFFFYYAINRHKMTTLTPAYHAEQYSPDDHRFDLRPFLYNPKFDTQFEKIDKVVKQFEEDEKVKSKNEKVIENEKKEM
ncbi:glutamine-dependent NAD(+) synthetase with GAT domain-containing protein [Neoconidiobolus thromboides FSU 785]|nr:glutamine-dependent NAD(+) synthetase with GAT domain-containing protein [Neoconidiobolus thromboides FSU 785]